MNHCGTIILPSSNPDVSNYHNDKVAIYSIQCNQLFAHFSYKQLSLLPSVVSSVFEDVRRSNELPQTNVQMAVIPTHPWTIENQ